MHARTILATLVIGSTVAAAAASAHAQDRAVVARLVEFGRMQQREAQALTRSVSGVLRDNAQASTDRYDRIRQAVGRSMFDGPGRTREEYEQRLTQVKDRMRAGLDEGLLAALFPSRPNAAVLCANDFGVTVIDCDALIAAAGRARAALPYTAPDDGQALKQALRAGHVRGRAVNEIAQKLRETMLSVPHALSADARGRGLIRLLERCPGAFSARESQIRAWHVGPTVGMAQCLAQAVAAGSTPAAARERAQMLFNLSAQSAEAFLGWGAPDAMASGAGAAAPRATHPPAAAPSAEDLLSQARAHFRANRLPQAAAAYEQVTRANPTNARAFAGLGSAKLRMRDARGAALAYRQAAALEPGNPSFHAFLGEALAAGGDRDGASAEYRQALAIQPNNFIASQGLSRLGAQANSAPGGGAPSGAGQMPPEQAADRWRQQGREHFQARRYPQAAAAYEQAARLAPSHAGSFAGLGAARLAMGDTAGAVSAYQSAVRIEPNRSSFWSALARAQAQSGDRGGAVASLQRALQLDPSNQNAQNGLHALGVQQAVASSTPAATPPQQQGSPTQAAGQTLPETPSRNQIIAVMRPLQGNLHGCAPGYTGRLTFNITVTGATGAVSDASVAEAELVDDAELSCMVGVLEGATFPHFSRETLENRVPVRVLIRVQIGRWSDGAPPRGCAPFLTSRAFRSKRAIGGLRCTEGESRTRWRTSSDAAR